jgi:hypothetical protein
VNDTNEFSIDEFAALHPRPIDVRRAVLGVLMRCAASGAGAVEGLSLGELRAALLSHDGIELDGKRLADLVRWQMRRGRVSRVRRARYAFVVGSMSPSSAWRCLHWQVLAKRVGTVNGR